VTGIDPRTTAVTVAYTSPVDCTLLYTAGDRVLLALRHGTGYADGQWNLPSGKLDAGETVDAAVCREAREEVGLRLQPDQVQLSVLLHWRNPEGQHRLGVVFHAEADPDRHGIPANAEPHKCAGIGWYPMDVLPANTVRYTAAAVHLHRHRIRFAAAAWPATDLLGELP
jgi:8-oxo-dGTP pyrophosphatase MutT (NUDIX family)